MVQKARINVDEIGTTASAANVATFSFKSARPSFVCDRPFLFMIKDYGSGANVIKLFTDVIYECS
jgi:serine protease inhibitor